MAFGLGAAITTLVVLATAALWPSSGHRSNPELSDEEVLRRSVLSVHVGVLNLAFAVDPSFCRVVHRATASKLGYVKCEDVPIHLFEALAVCYSNEADCRPINSDYTDCVDYEWNIDLLGRPISPLPQNSKDYLSGSSGKTNCNKGWTAADIDRQLEALGLSRIKVKIFGMGKGPPIE